MTDHLQLQDRNEITDVLLRYFRALDRLDRDLLETLFADDAHLDYPGAFTGGKDDCIDWVMSVVGACAQTVHLAGNILVDIDGDRAWSETYATAYHTVARDIDHPWAGKFVTMWIRYIDEFERRSPAWQITRRQVAHAWTRIEEDETTTAADSPSRRDLFDPVYRRKG